MRKKFLYWAPFLAMGPITGPLAEGVVRSWRRGDKILAGLYVLAIPSSYLALGVAGASML